MELSEPRDSFPGIGEASFNQKHAVAWVEQKPAVSQVLYAHDIFKELLKSASKPKQSSGNYCVKLCGFVDQCSKSQSSSLKVFAFAEKTAWDLFNFFVEWNEQDQHRSMRLVLEFLKISISNSPDPEIGGRIKTRILNEIISMITLQSTKPSIKSAMIALDHFLQKKILYLSNVLDIYRDVHQIDKEVDISWNEFIYKIFGWMQHKHVWPVAGKLLTTIFVSYWYQDQDAKFLPDAWHKFLYHGLETNIELLEPIKVYIFVPLFKTDREQSLKYLDDLFSLQSLTTRNSNDLDLNSIIWLAALEAGKKVGIVDEPGGESLTTIKHQAAAPLPANVLEDILCHTSHEARSSAVSILIASPSTTKPYTTESLKLLRKHLPAFQADTDARFRDIERNSNKKAKLEKTNTTSTKDVGDQLKVVDHAVARDALVLQDHENFVHWYLDFLKQELVPTASYQRHITSLKAMTFVLNSGLLEPDQVNMKNGFQLVDSTWLRAVLDLVMDPFEDVRETAASLLTLLSPIPELRSSSVHIAGLSRTLIEDLEEFCRRSSVLASKTSRADHSDGVARSYEALCRWTVSTEKRLLIAGDLLGELETRLVAAQKDLASAILEAPVHGSFASLRYIWEALSGSSYSPEEILILDSLQTRAFDCCRKIWQTVRHVLCDDSPEGHLPEELEEVEGLDTKDLLSYSFRAIHESSNLLRAMAGNARNNGKPSFLAPSPDTFKAIGFLTFEQLSNLRHRGAFTTVSQTFTSCCQLVKCFASLDTSERGLLEEWYKGTIDCIYSQASTTRRSAGIPSLMVGILSANSDHPSFDFVVHQLQDIARQPARISETDGSNLPQVHALNCLKDIFKNSYLSRQAEVYLTECLQLAANSLKSEVWAIRNCGLLLLRSLIDCLFGTSESKASMEAGWDGRSTKIAWHKYKALPTLLVSLLEIGQQTAATTASSPKGAATAESVFPALDIIRRAGPPEEVKDKLFDIVAWYLGSHMWHVREMAARTLCSFLLKDSWVEPICALLSESRRSANKLHGALLTFKFLLERLLEVMPDQLLGDSPDILFAILEEIPMAGGSFNSCPEVRAVYFEILSFANSLAGDEATVPSLNIEQKAVKPVLNMPDTNNGKPPSSSALMKSKQAKASIAYDLRQISSTDGELREFDLLDIDVNLACNKLETLLSHVAKSGHRRSNSSSDGALVVEQQLISACLTTCLQTVAPEPRTLALEILADQLDLVLQQQSAFTGEGGLEGGSSSSQTTAIPSTEQLAILWADLQTKPMNPGLADAVVRASGSIMAAVVARAGEPYDAGVERWLRCWGDMMSDAGLADKGFDTRMAAIIAIKSFSTHVNMQESKSTAHLPWLLALYDALNDDDDEIRNIAAQAATPLLDNKSLVSIEAGDRLLLNRLAPQYGHTPEFRNHVICRMTGHSPPPPPPQNNTDNATKHWTPARDQLEAAMRFDDALFVVEEQNLYIDEVRETQRWRAVFSSLFSTSDPPDPALKSWTLEGLETLTVECGKHEDGVLGWTSKPEVFAICSRIVTCGAAMAVLDDDGEDVRDAVGRFWRVGCEGQVHGLLGMCGLE